ncbi:hypothetical protein [Streptomyces sp. YIM S03343]
MAAFMFDTLSGLSEAAYNERWHAGTEYGAWTLLTVPRFRWGRVRADEPDVAPALAILHTLALQAGIWLTWPASERAPIPMTLDNWRVRYATASPTRRRPA